MHQLSALQSCLNAYVKVSDGDLRAAFAGVILHDSGRHGRVYCTQLFLDHLFQLFYEECNVRGCRRQLAEFFSFNYIEALAHACAQQQDRDDHTCIFRSLPAPHALATMLTSGLWNFVKDRVYKMRRRHLLYNAKGIRGDGNFKIAKRNLYSGGGGELVPSR